MDDRGLMLAGSQKKWPSATRERPCPKCGKTNRCRIAPDGLAGICWRSGVEQNWRDGSANGNGHSNGNGHHHRPDPKPTRPKKTFVSSDNAVAAVAKSIAGKILATTIYTYSDSFLVARFDLEDSKEFRPVHKLPSGWAVGDPEKPLPLYHLSELPGTGLVYICEGEKATDHARSIGLPTVTSSHGSSQAKESNWSPLAGRDVVILADNDAAGAKYAADVAGILLATKCRCKIVNLPGLPPGGDIVEFDAERAADAGATRAAVENIAERTPWIDATEIIGGPVLRRMSEIEVEPIQWLWDSRIARGKISLLGGVPGAGKSWLSLFMAAAVSTGGPWPDGRGNAPIGDVVICSAEDGAADTVKPRLVRMGADCTRIHILDCVRRPAGDGKMIEASFNLSHVHDLEQAIRSVGAALVIIDPISAYLGEADEHRNGEVRSILKPIARLAEKYQCAIVCVTHLTKGTGSNSVHRMIGSIAFAGAARSVWMVSRDPLDEARRKMLLAKCNIAPTVGGLAYRIIDGALEFEPDPINESADQALAAESEHAEHAKPGPEPEQQREAEDFLRAMLASGEVAAATIKKEAISAGLSWRTVQRAREAIGAMTEKNQFSGGWQWRFRKPGTGEDAETTCQASREP